MTDEQFEKRMDFIVEQQAQFAAAIQKLEEAQVRREQSEARTDERIQVLATVSLSFANHLETLAHHVEEIDRRLESFISETNTSFQATDEKIRKLAESQTHTDQRLDALIEIVRRQIERGNGQQGSD